jgi:hypothetical protein
MLGVTYKNGVVTRRVVLYLAFVVCLFLSVPDHADASVSAGHCRFDEVAA